MKKLLVLFALFSSVMLLAFDVQEMYYCDAGIVAPDASYAPDGWAIAIILDSAGDGIDGIDTATRLPIDDDVFPSFFACR